LNTNANTNDITTSVNEFTGDKLISKHATQRYRDNYDMIFHHHKKDGELASLAEMEDSNEGQIKDSEGKI
jgi:hypothetical protein